MKRMRNLALASILGMALGPTSCSLTSLDAGGLSRVKDSVPPEIIIDSPSDGSHCANIVEIKGSVLDRTNEGGAGSLSSFTYEVPGSLVSDTITADAAGHFVFRFGTGNLGPSFSVKLRAVDWNGNATSQGLSLSKNATSSIPDFTASVLSKKVALSWDPVPETRSYELYYSDNGSLPSETVGTKLTVTGFSRLLEDLENGRLYTFRLRAVASPGYEDSWSDFVEVIPLSPRTLVPDAVPGRGKIELSWDDIPATDGFDIYRRVGEEGDFTRYRSVTGTSFVDTGVRNGEHYYYRISPAGDSSVLSEPEAGMTDGFSRGASTEKIAGITLRTPDLAWRGEVLFAGGWGGVQVLLPSYGYLELARISLTSVWKVVAPEGSDLLFLAAGREGLRIYDTQQPIAPYPLGQFATAGIDARAVAVHLDPLTGRPSRAYVADYCRAVHCLDISDPAAPVLLKTYTIGGTDRSGADADDLSYAMVLSPDDTWLYVGDRSDGVQVIRTADPDGSGPVLEIPAGQYTYGLTLQGATLYACAGNGGLVAIDVSDPPVAARIGTLDVGANASVLDVVIEGSNAFVANRSLGVQIVDIADPTAPRLIENISMPMDFSSTGTHSIALHEGSAYVYHMLSYNNYGIYAVDLNIPVGIKLSSSVSFPETPNSIDVAGPYAYVADGYSGIRVLDIRDPEAVVEVGRAPTSLLATRIVVSGTHAYVAEPGGPNYNGWGDIEIFDISDPTNPILVTSFAGASGSIPEGTVRDLAVRGDYVYSLTFSGGLLIWDVSNPAEPFRVQTFTIPINSERIVLKGDLALISDWLGYLVVVDITDPRESALVRTAAIADRIEDFSVCGDAALFTLGFSGFILTDLAHPATDSTSAAWQLSFGDPGNPGLFYENFDSAAGHWPYMVVSSMDLNVPTSNGHLRIYDITDTHAPRLIQHISTPLDPAGGFDSNMDMKLIGAVIYACGADGVLRVYNLRP